ncbi:hypothetical protein Trydic_g21916 [Trypoxylus dichotomus]
MRIDLSTTLAIMQEAEKRFQAILEKIECSNISRETIAELEIVKKLCGTERKFKTWPFLIVAILFATFYLWHSLSSPDCFLEIPFEASKVFRLPEDCSICINVTQVDRVTNISPEDFDKTYAAKGRPVVISDGTKDWEAVEKFTFDFFKKLYNSVTRNREDKTACQFFPYKTEFQNLYEVFNMSIERSRLEPGTKHWYIGWSNCNDNAGKILRKFYREPYFLPKTSENMALNWIFMGGPGSGAHMHVDDVVYPSWQAQLKGRKTWYLAPVPECLYKCKSFEVTVEPGEIIVVDTNRWYHQTHILPGSLSITIGSEFD